MNLLPVLLVRALQENRTKRMCISTQREGGVTVRNWLLRLWGLVSLKSAEQEVGWRPGRKTDAAS